MVCMEKLRAIKRVGIFLMDCHRLKANRDKISGILKYSGSRPDWEVRLFNVRKPFARAPRVDFPLDGAIIGAPLPLQRLARCHVLIDPEHARAGSVNVDNRAIARMAAEFLVRRGHAVLAYVGTNRPDLNRHAKIRQDEFRKVAEEIDATLFEHEIDEQHPMKWTNELERLAEFVGKLPKPCGLMACADEIAKSVLDACRLAHVTVPEQMAIVGVDNELEICENLRPTLTSVRPDFERCGYVAARLLDQAMRDRKRHPTGKYVYGARELVERESTVDLKGGGRLVAAAMKIIRQQALAGLTVADIARTLNCSARLLEIRFQDITGGSVKDAILRLRLEKVQQLLQETNCPIEEIHRACGWSTHIALHALFKRRFGLSMRDFRQARRKAEDAFC